MKILAVGDVHTKKWIFDLVESVIDDYDAVVFCGDYADNWGASASDSLATWYRLYDLCNRYPDKILPVRGNHDYIYTVQTPTLQSGYNYETQLLINAPEHQELKKWLLFLPLIRMVDGVTYAHAGIDERWTGDQDVMTIWNDISPIWVRPGWAQYKKIPQVVGHTPQQTVTEVQPGIWLIDTFSTYPDGSPIGDGTMLEVIDGKEFQKIKINANNNDSPDIEDPLSRKSPRIAQKPITQITISDSSL
jgi:hypothetical protein